MWVGSLVGLQGVGFRPACEKVGLLKGFSLNY
jgi:hypothetical protein